MTGNDAAASDALHTRRPRRAWIWAWLGVIAALTIIFALDRNTRLTAIQHLYYGPIIFASIRFGHRGSLAVTGAAILLYHLANLQPLSFRYEESDVVQMVLFVAVGVVSAKLANDTRRLRLLSITDDLTGLHNLRSFEIRLRALVRASRQGLPLALLVLDVDRLKSLNDVHGHLTGADAVRSVGHIIAKHLPRGAVACRYGGDEFVIAVPDCTETRALGVANDLRHAVNAAAPVLDGVSFPAGTLSISVGVACGLFDRRTPSDAAADAAAGEQLFRTADAALYASKNSGRNCVSVAALIMEKHRRS